MTCNNCKEEHKNENTGCYSTGYYSTGYYSTGHRSTGHRSTGDRSTGDRSTGDYSTGHHSTGYCSTGDRSTGNHSTGYYSTGYRSTGNHSTGYHSTGDHSTGDCSTGNWSISKYSTGHFSTEDYSGFGVFDKPCTPEEWNKATIPSFLYWDLTVWINKEDMTDKEKEDNPTYKTTQGYLKVRTYQEAWRSIYDTLSDKERADQIKQLEALPNYNAEKFKLISGIDIEADKKGKTKDEIVVDGIKYIRAK